MNRIDDFLRLSEWALQFVFVPPLCVGAALAAISLAWAATQQRPLRKGLWKRHHWLVLTQTGFFGLAIGIGVIWANPNTNPTIPHPANSPAEPLLDCVFLGSILSCLFWIWRMKGFRWFAASLVALLEMPTFAALFVAGMSVSGDWL
jgi:hypothetical protein